MLVAEAGDELEGFASYGPSRNEDAERIWVGEISTIYVLAAAWGQGLGRRLMAGAVERLAAAGYAQATLWVLDTNARARRFYAAAGWSRTGPRWRTPAWVSAGRDPLSPDANLNRPSPDRRPWAGPQMVSIFCTAWRDTPSSRAISACETPSSVRPRIRSRRSRARSWAMRKCLKLGRGPL